MAANMGCRPARHHDVVRAHFPAVRCARKDSAQRLVAVADALRLAGAAGGKEDDRWVLHLLGMRGQSARATNLDLHHPRSACQKRRRAPCRSEPYCHVSD
jgi:hypothetical protein